MCLVVKSMKKGENKNTKWENSWDKYMVINISKTIISVRKKQCNISSHMNYLQFAFKGLKYARNTVFLLIFWQSFWNIKKAE